MKSKEISVPLLFTLGLIACFLFLAETARILSIEGVNVNLILVFFTLAIFLADSFLILFVPLVLLVVFSFLTAPFWIGDMLILAAVIVLFYFLKRFLTGSRFVDFLITLVLASALFYGILALLFGTPWLSVPFVFETCCGLILGSISWWAIKIFKLAR